METGESRTRLTPESQSTVLQPQPVTGTILDADSEAVQAPVDSNPDPTLLVSQLLDQLIVLGQTARQLRATITKTNSSPAALGKVIQQLTEGGERHGEE